MCRYQKIDTSEFPSPYHISSLPTTQRSQKQRKRTAKEFRSSSHFASKTVSRFPDSKLRHHFDVWPSVKRTSATDAGNDHRTDSLHGEPVILVLSFSKPTRPSRITFERTSPCSNKLFPNDVRDTSPVATRSRALKSIRVCSCHFKTKPLFKNRPRVPVFGSFSLRRPPLFNRMFPRHVLPFPSQPLPLPVLLFPCLFLSFRAETIVRVRVARGATMMSSVSQFA